ncbi:MAG: hypothetical protein HY348_15850 [Nitrospira defluvii]|nr:hypothetical protein [Nitrospira defluvii]
MQKPWISGGATLLAIFQAIRGNGSIERSLLDRRTGSFSQRWPGVLTGLSAVEAALLQDLTWWGPLMESRLQQLTGSRAKTRTDR